MLFIYYISFLVEKLYTSGYSNKNNLHFISIGNLFKNINHRGPAG